MLSGQQPIIILREGTTRDKGKDARRKNILAATLIADAAKSTLGPKGMDKMLVDSTGNVVITNDGATILQEIEVEHPAARVIVEVAKAQDQECGDGTTTAVILTGELLKQAEKLLDKNIHPTIINAGYKLAADKAIQTLHKIAISLSKDDKKTLKYIAMTAMSSKGSSQSKEHLAEVIVDAVLSIQNKRRNEILIDLDDIHLQKQQGSTIDQTEIFQGIIINKEPVNKDITIPIKNASIAVINQAFEIKKTEIDARINIKDPQQLQAFLNEEERMIKKLVQKVIDSNANVLICQKGIDDIAQYYLTEHDILAVQRVSDSEMKKIAKATGAKIISYVEELTEKDLGHAGIVETRNYGNDTYTVISSCKNPKAVSILLRGGTEHVVDELQRAIHDSLSVVKAAVEEGKIIVGGGAAATEIAMTLRNYAPHVGGRQQMAIEAYADAVEIIPKTLARNAGLDSINIMLELRRQHKKGNPYVGFNALNGLVENLHNKHIIEPLKLGLQQIQAATEASAMILRIDDVIAAKTIGGTARGHPPGMGEFDE